MLRWQPGRMGTGYRKIVVGHGSWWDLHLLDYPKGTYIPEHVDILPQRRHLRVNLAIRTGGSKLMAESVLFRIRERLIVFWSDKSHEVTPTNSRRTVISIGLALPNWGD